MRKLNLVFVLFVLAAALRILFHVLVRPIAWDAAAYIGIAKAIATLGTNGLWEPLRPLVWSILLSPFAALHANIIVAAHALQFVIGMGVVVLVYFITKRAFGNRAALWALGLAAISPILIFYEHQLLTEQPAAFFALLSVFLLQRENLFLAGMSAGISFLTKFPEGMIIVALGTALVFSSGK